jgi:hypothetical protein
LGVADATYLLYLLARVVWTCARRRALLAGLALATVISAYVSYRVGSAPELYRRLSTYSDEMGIERPHLLVGDVGQPNAFAVGGGLGRGAVVLDRRLFGLLSLDELSAIVAHELAHVDHRDSMVQTFGFSALQTLPGLARRGVERLRERADAGPGTPDPRRVIGPGPGLRPAIASRFVVRRLPLRRAWGVESKVLYSHRESVRP